MIRQSRTNIIRKIAFKELLLQKRRTTMIIIAIVLAAFILSLCGAMGFAVYHSQKNLSEDTFEVLFYNLSKEKIEALNKYSYIERVALTNNLVKIEDEKGVTISLDYLDDNAYYVGRNQYKLLEGRFPREGNEIVASEEYIKKYAPKCKSGDKLSLQVNQKQFTFKLTGIVSFPTTVEDYYSFFITEDFLESNQYYNSSSYTTYVHFKDSTTISKEEFKERVIEIASDLDTTYDYSALFLKNNREVSIGNIILFLCITIIVLFAGIVVIQSVFYISISEKIRSYGQMCVVGATKEQLKGIIKKESSVLILCGTSIGILLGDIVGTVLGGNRLVSGFDLNSVLGLSGVVFIICAIMVRISTYKPIKLILNLSPIEAQKHIDSTNNSIAERKSSKKITLFWLTIGNIYRDKKKVFRTMISLIWGGVLMLISASMVTSFSAEQSVQKEMFKNGGAHRLYVNDAKLILNENPLTPELEQEITLVDGINEVIPIRESVGECDLKTKDVYVGGMCDILSDTGSFEGQVDFVSQYLIQGKIPTDKNEILLADVVQEVRPVSVGEHATLTIGNSKIDVTIVGFFDATYVGTPNGRNAEDGANVMITNELAQEVFPKTKNFKYSWEVINNNFSNREIQNELLQVISNKNISIASLETEVSHLESQMNLIWGGVQLISFFIMLFALSLIHISEPTRRS